jgi:hypothetical protein
LPPSPVSAGPPDEATQSLAFTVTNSNSGLFKTPLVIDSFGNLTFAAKPNASGAATVAVTLQDNGGTANNGRDTSATQTFTITVTKPHPLHNTARPLDTDDDTFIAPLDALLIGNYLNNLRFGGVPPTSGPPYFDTSRNNQISPLDALLIINHLNDLLTHSAQPEGESAPLMSDPATAVGCVKRSATHQMPLAMAANLLDLLAADTAPHKPRRRP